MKLQLISNKEKRVLTLKSYSDTKVFYRRITTEAYHVITKNHVSKGIYDADSAVRQCLKEYVIGWEGVVDEKGKNIEFDSNLLQYFTDEAQSEMIDAVRGTALAQGDSVIEKEKK